MIKAIPLKRSIRQECPLAPLLYAITIDGLNWLVVDRINKGQMQGINLPTRQSICMDMFADESNTLVTNDPESISCFWECLKIYYKASCSMINHNKMHQMVERGTTTMAS